MLRITSLDPFFKNLFFFCFCVHIISFFLFRILDEIHRCSDSDAEESRESSPLQREDSKVTGLVTDTNTAHHEEGAASNTTSRNDTWKINAILAFLASWYAMILTGWGSIAESGNEANPTASRVSMWIIIGSQWLVFALYIWSMVAPSLFPDRDFS